MGHRSAPIPDNMIRDRERRPVFKSRTITLLVVALMLLSLALVACSGDGGATATSPAAQALIESAKTKDANEVAASEAAADSALTVAGKAFSMAELEALATATASTEDGDVTGISLMAVLEAAGVTAETISLVASDGYSADVTVAEIDDTAVLVVEDGKLNAIIPTVAKSAWVDDVVSISAK